MKSLQGQLLIASPHLGDPNFARAVVLMVQHNDDGAFGVVLNRPLNKTIQELWAEVDEPPCDNRQHLNLGGPVSGPLMALHAPCDICEVEVVPGVYFAHEKENLERLVQAVGVTLRVFVGHSGWGGGQLEREMEEGAWLTLPATAEMVFLPEDELWNTVTRHIGHQFLTDVLHVEKLPPDPSVN